MKRQLLSFMAKTAAVFLFALTNACGVSEDAAETQASLPIVELDPGDVAAVVADSANSLAQAGGPSSPTLNFLTTTETAPLYAITGFTFSTETGMWTGTTQFGVTPSIKFYQDSDESLIMVDATDSNQYFPGGALFGLVPPGEDNTDILIEITATIAATLSGDYSFATVVMTGKLPATDANTDSNAAFSFTGASGTITGDLGTINTSNIELTAAQLGAEVEGNFDFTITVDDETVNGTASFDEDGCNGASLTDGDGTPLGTAEINDQGVLVFTDASSGETTELDRLI